MKWDTIIWKCCYYMWTCVDIVSAGVTVSIKGGINCQGQGGVSWERVRITACMVQPGRSRNNNYSGLDMESLEDMLRKVIYPIFICLYYKHDRLRCSTVKYEDCQYVSLILEFIYYLRGRHYLEVSPLLGPGHGKVLVVPVVVVVLHIIW